MSRNKIQQECETILQLIALYQQGATIDDIVRKLKISIARRTLQRRLAHLVETSQLISQGEKRGRRYFLGEKVAVTESVPGDETYIPISREAKEIRDHARQAITRRRTVSYNREFLDAYKPNESFYLPESVRQHLHSLNVGNDGNHPAGTFARKIYNRLLIDLSWNSSRLEGNTYSLLETEKLINLGQTVEGKDRIETKMILNHKAVIEFLIENVDHIGFNRYTILNIHALLSDELLGDPAASGRLRSIAVGIGSSSYNPPHVPQLIDECFNKILDTVSAIVDPFEQSFFVMVHLPYLQPFEDVNKRVSRLSANIPMILNNLSPISFVEVSERAYIDGIIGVYELNNIKLLQEVYVWAYERSCYRYSKVRQTLVEPDPFRLKYSKMVSDLVRKIVFEHQTQNEAFAFIRQWVAENVPNHNRVRFIEMTEAELIGLHEGNIARHQLPPDEFKAWQKKWD